MRKGLFFLLAALLVVGLPLSALAGTEVYKVKDAAYGWNGFPFCFEPPYGPAAVFNKPVCVMIEGATISETVRVKYPKGYSSSNPGDIPPDVGWNRVGHGQVTIFDPSGGENFVATSFAQKVIGVKASAPSSSAWWEILYTGPFQLEEVVQDDGNKTGCWGGMGLEVTFEQCGYGGQFDYVMFHWKLTGNSLNSFWKITIKNGEYCNNFQPLDGFPEVVGCYPIE